MFHPLLGALRMLRRPGKTLQPRTGLDLVTDVRRGRLAVRVRRCGSRRGLYGLR
jgi:hypothetical protein